MKRRIPAVFAVVLLSRRERFSRPVLCEEEKVPELLKSARLRTASVFVCEKNLPPEKLREEDVIFVGSAFAYSERCLATCAHLFEGQPRRLLLRFGDGRWASAELRGSCAAADVAVLRTDADAALEALPLCAAPLRQGQRVVVCGMTQHGREAVGLSGLVSQPRQQFRGLPDDPTACFVQLALPTLPGMSGSPVLDAEGQVRAMVAKKFEEHGLAIPTVRFWPVLECLEAGYAWRLPMLGMEVKVGGSLMEPAVVVKKLGPGAAAAAGVQVGDEIIAINDARVASLLEMREALLALGDVRRGAALRLRLRRGGKTLAMDVEAPRAPPGPQDVFQHSE